jgi:hypothetical protein
MAHGRIAIIFSSCFTTANIRVFGCFVNFKIALDIFNYSSTNFYLYFMVDIERRKKLAFHLRQLAVGLTSNDDFEDAVAEDVTDGWLPEQYYRSKTAKYDDLIIIPMLELSWGLYSDARKHRLTGSDKLTPEALRVVARCILFLRSDQEYKWPYFDVKPNFALLDYLFAIFTFGSHLKPKMKEQEEFYLQWQKLGDFDVWPFFSSADYDSQLRNQPYLNGV